MERTAAEAERASVKYKQVEFMKDRIGEVFDGIISGVTEWGIYVEIVENRCEGMVKVRDMRSDQFIFDEDNYRYIGKNSNRIFALGDPVKVIVKEADLVKKQLTYAFDEGEGANKRQPREDRNKNNDHKRRRGR